MNWLRFKIEKRRQQDPYLNLAKYPYGAEKLKDSTDNVYGTRPAAEETFPETVYPYQSNEYSRHNDDGYTYDSSNALGRRHWDYDTLSHVECTNKNWLKKMT